MAARRPISLVILAGFLGAGKTTLLNRLLKDPGLKDTVVVINEFGEIALDHLLVEQATEGPIEIGGGCLCCTARGELADTLLELAKRSRPVRRVIVETTGLADPVPVLQLAMAHPELSQAYSIECVITVVDAVNGTDTLNAYEEARKQVALADRIVVTKADLAPDDDREVLLHHLAALNPDAELLDSRCPSSVAAETLLRTVFEGRQMPNDQHGEHDHGGHSHAGHHHSHRDFLSVSLTLDRPMLRAAIENFLDLLASQLGEQLLRIKGLVETTEDPGRPLLIQGAQRVLHAPEILPEWPRGERGTRIVVIGRAFDPDYVRRIFAAFAGQTALDTPDRAAVEQNPLAIPGFRV